MSGSGRASDFMRQWGEGHNQSHTSHVWGEDDCLRCAADLYDPWQALVRAAEIAGFLPKPTEIASLRVEDFDNWQALADAFGAQIDTAAAGDSGEYYSLLRWPDGREAHDLDRIAIISIDRELPSVEEQQARYRASEQGQEDAELLRRQAAERLAHPLIQLPGDGLSITSHISRAIDTVQAVRNQFEPSYALVEFTEALIAQLMAVRRGQPWPVPEVAHVDGPDAGCPHMEFEAGVTVQRILGDNLVVAGFWAEVMVACRACDEIFRWTGVPVGLSPGEPRVSIDHRTLLAPFHRASRDPDEGKGLPGFDVNLVGPELGHERTAAAIRRRALEDAAELVKARVQPAMSVAARRELRHAEAALRQLALEAQ